MKLLLLITLSFLGVSCEPPMITVEEADTVRTSWDVLKHREVSLLYKIFKENPEIQQRFPTFAGKDLEKLKTSPGFAIHATRIIGYFTQIVQLNGFPDSKQAMDTLINELANSHRNRGIPKELFNQFRKSFDGYFKKRVSWTEEINTPWQKTTEYFYRVLFEALDGQYFH